MTATRNTEKLSRFVEEALLAPQQACEVVLAPADRADDKADATHGSRPTHAHGDFGHGDFGHADR